MNRCTLLMRLTGVPESSLPSPDKKSLHSFFQISSEPYSSLLPFLSLRHRPAHSTCRWDLTGDLSNVPGILLKKATQCAVFSQV